MKLKFFIFKLIISSFEFVATLQVLRQPLQHSRECEAYFLQHYNNVLIPWSSVNCSMWPTVCYSLYYALNKKFSGFFEGDDVAESCDFEYEGVQIIDLQNEHENPPEELTSDLLECQCRTNVYSTASEIHTGISDLIVNPKDFYVAITWNFSYFVFGRRDDFIYRIYYITDYYELERVI